MFEPRNYGNGLVEPKLYIIMRQDVPDMNPGKAMAQAAHAQAAFDKWIHLLPHDAEERGPYAQWLGDRAFGTTIVLHAEKEMLQERVEQYGVQHPYLVVDPTYPYTNWYGQLFVTSMITCWWFFIGNHSFQEEIDFYRSLEMHP